MKKRGRYSVANAGRVMPKIEAPPPNPLRDRTAEEVREALVRAMPNPGRDADETTAEALIEGMMQVAAELTSAAPPGIRNWQRDRAIRFYTRAVTLTVGEWHRRQVNRVVHEPPPAAPKQEEQDFPPLSDDLKELGPVLSRYINSLQDAIADIMQEDDPKGSSLMMLYGLIEVAAKAVAGAPAEYRDRIEGDLVSMFTHRVKRNKELRSNEPDAAD